MYESIQTNFIETQQSSKTLYVTLDYGGFGAMYARRKLAFQMGHALNRKIVFVQNGCTYDNPFTHPIVEISSVPTNAVPFTQNFIENKADSIILDFDNYWNHPKRDQFQIYCPLGIPYSVYGGMLLHEMLYFKPEYEEFITTKINSLLPKDKKILGIHIRRGNKTVDSPYIPTNAFALLAKKLITQGLDFNMCYVTSECVPTINQCIKDLVRFTHFKESDIIVDNDEFRHHTPDWQISKNNTENGKLVALTASKIVGILEHCDYVIGGCNTQLAKLGGSLCSWRNQKNSISVINPFTLQTSDVIGTNADDS